MPWRDKQLTAADVVRAKQYASPEHRAQVAAVRRLVASGDAWCWRCRRHLPPGSKAHAGHDDHDRTVYRGAECPPCNLKAAASKGARVANARRKAARTTSRRWQ